MGKASRWFRGLLGMKKIDSTTTTTTTTTPSPKDKRRWSFVKSHREKHYHHPLSNADSPADDNKDHAIAVAAATAAVAEAAVAAAQAAAAVVRLTSNSGRCVDAAGLRIRQQWAAVKIQAAFRGSLARKALRALKGLVKLQALVRGHIERKRTAEWLKRMQALLQAQARVSAGWTLQYSHSTAKLSSHINGPATPEKFESPIRSKSVKSDQSPVLKRNCSRSCVQINGNQEKRVSRSSESQGRSLTRTYSANEERSDRILESDSGNSLCTSKRRNLFALGSDHHSKSLSYTTKESTTSLQSGQSSSCEVHSYIHSPQKIEESPFCTANNSPQYLSATSKDETFKRSPFTPTKSDGTRSCYIRGYSDYPSYMACTESSKAKVRSLSAPKQRPHQRERSYSSSSTRYSLNGYDMSRLASSQRASTTIQSSFANKAYPGSGRLDRLGMPVGYRY